MLGEDVKSWFTHKRRGLRSDNLCLVDGSQNGSSPAQTSWKEAQPHVKRFTVYTIGTKKKLWIQSVFFFRFWFQFTVIRLFVRKNVLTFAYSLLLLTLRIKTLTVRVENSWCGFQKTLNVRLEIGPLIREFATPLQKDFFFKKRRSIRKSR